MKSPTLHRLCVLSASLLFMVACSHEATTTSTTPPPTTTTASTEPVEPVEEEEYEAPEDITEHDGLELTLDGVDSMARARAYEELLESVGRHMDEVLAALPREYELASNILHLTAFALGRLGRYQDRIAHYTRFAEAIAGTGDIDIIDDLRLSLANAYDDYGDYDAALHALEGADLACSDEDRLCRALLAQRVILYAYKGDVARTQRDADALVAIGRANEGAEAASAINSAAWALTTVGKHREAFALIDPVIRALIAHPDEDASLGNFLNTRGVALLGLNRSREADADFARDVALRREVPESIDHDEGNVSALVWACFGASRANRHEAAIALCEEAITTGTRLLSPDHALVALARVRLGQARIRARQRDAGLVDVRAGLEIMTRTLHMHHVWRMMAEQLVAPPRPIVTCAPGLNPSDFL